MVCVESVRDIRFMKQAPHLRTIKIQIYVGIMGYFWTINKIFGLITLNADYIFFFLLARIVKTYPNRFFDLKSIVKTMPCPPYVNKNIKRPTYK